MNTFLKYLGVLLVLAGVGVLAFYTFGTQSNTYLITAGSLMVVGLLEFILVNKFVK